MGLSVARTQPHRFGQQGQGILGLTRSRATAPRLLQAPQLCGLTRSACKNSGMLFCQQRVCTRLPTPNSSKTPAHALQAASCTRGQGLGWSATAPRPGPKPGQAGPGIDNGRPRSSRPETQTASAPGLAAGPKPKRANEARSQDARRRLSQAATPRARGTRRTGRTIFASPARPGCARSQSPAASARAACPDKKPGRRRR